MKKLSLLIGMVLIFCGVCFAQTANSNPQKNAKKTVKKAQTTHKIVKSGKTSIHAFKPAPVPAHQPPIPKHKATPVIKAVPSRTN